MASRLPASPCSPPPSQGRWVPWRLWEQHAHVGLCAVREVVGDGGLTPQAGSHTWELGSACARGRLYQHTCWDPC